jgi:hypothetical protein
MRMIHPAAWVGLFLNVVLAFMFFHALETMDLSALEMTQQEAWGELRMFLLETVRPFYLTLLLLQSVALFLIVFRVPFALGVAFICGLLTLPVGIVYMLGTLLTHCQMKYADFDSAPVNYARALHIFPSFISKKMRILAGVSFGAFALLVLMKNINMATTLLSLAIAGFYCALRAGKNHALALYDDGLALTPSLFSPTLVLPYSSITLATLQENETIRFEVNTPGGSRFLVWPLLAVAPERRREAIEELGAALHARGVPLQ